MAVYKKNKPTKDGRQFYFRIKYKDIFGEEHDYNSPRFKTKKEAELEEAKYRLTIEEQKTCTTNITIRQAYAEYINEKAKKVKKQTIIKEQYRFAYIEPIADKKINDITVPIYKKWRVSFDKEELAPITKNKVIQLLRRIIQYSSKYYNTQDTILKFIDSYTDVNEMKKEMQFFTLEEYKQFDSVIDHFEYHTLFEILYYQGIRVGELQGLTWKDVDFNKNTININKTVTTKIKGEQYTISKPKTKNSTRILPMTKQVSIDLKTLKNEAMKYDNFEDKWFCFGNSKPFGETRIQNAKNKYCELAGVKQIRVHDFRHSCASLLINQGASIALVSKFLGHSNISITLNTYTHLYESELTNITDKLNKLQ